jgi:hypothetical protein
MPRRRAAAVPRHQGNGYSVQRIIESPRVFLENIFDSAAMRQCGIDAIGLSA